MPFTPYHFGPALLIGILLVPFIDFSAIIIASVILDLEPLFVILFNLPLPLHGFFHTYLAATIVAVLLTAFLWLFCNHLNRFVSIFGIHQKSTSRSILFGSIIGTYSHVFLDSFLYAEMNPFYPLLGNPFLNLVSSAFVYNTCVYSGLLGLAAYIGYLLYQLLKPKMVQDVQTAFE